MDFADQIRQFIDNVQKIKANVVTEQAVKQSLVLPLLQILGYNIFDPNEVIPEYNADPKNQIGIKKGEKVDYAVVSNGAPLFLMEVKGPEAELNPHTSQVIRYFTSTSAKFAIITNGIKYLFYTDLDDKNKMDSLPFLDISLNNEIRDSELTELKKFHKSYYDAEDILSAAMGLKYSSAIKQYLKDQFADPSEEFSRFVIKKVYDGMVTKAVLEEFEPIIKKSFMQYVNEVVSDRFKTAYNDAKEVEKKEGEIDAKPKIVTTEEEIEAFHIVRSILCQAVPVEKISYKDTQSYFAILYDGSTWKWICRLDLRPNQKYVIFPDSVEEDRRKISFESIEELYGMSEILKQSLNAILSS